MSYEEPSADGPVQFIEHFAADVQIIGRILSDVLQQETKLIESDARALGIVEANTRDYELVHQAHDGHIVYRGFRKDGQWVWDRHPDWPTIDLGSKQ